MLIDVILLLILLALALSGYRKGLLMSLLGLLTVVLCCLGASWAQQALTPRAAEYLVPQVASTLESTMTVQVAEATQQTLEQAGEVGLKIGGQEMTLSDIAELLAHLGIDVEGTVTEETSNALAPAVETAAQAAAQALVERVAGVFIYLVAFLILYLLLHSGALALNVMSRLPVIHTLNQAGGALVGIAEGMLAMVVAAAVLRQSGLVLQELGPFSALLMRLAASLF